MKKTINVGIIGAGNIANKLSEAFHFVEETNLYAIASRSLEKAQKFAEKNNIPNAYGSYEDMLNDENVDLVYIATPHSEHYKLAMLCVNHGKAVLCEKAFTMNAIEAHHLLDLAKQKQVYVGEAMWTRYLPYVKPLQKALEDGAIGDVRTMTASFGFNGQHRDRLNNPELAGGALLDLGVYTLTHASLVFGDEFNFMDATAIMLDTGVDGQNSVTITYPHKKMALLHTSLMSPLDNIIVIYGTKGKITLNAPACPQGFTVTNNETKEVTKHDYKVECNGYEYEIRQTAQNILAGKLQCDIFPHEKIIFMMESMDTIRQQWGLVYPNELTR